MVLLERVAAGAPLLPALDALLNATEPIDEVYVVAGHKGSPTAVAKRGARGDAGG